MGEAVAMSRKYQHAKREKQNPKQHFYKKYKSFMLLFLTKGWKMFQGPAISVVDGL